MYRVDILVLVWLPWFFIPKHHRLIVFFIALNFANLSFILRSYFDAWKGLPNVVLTFLMCLIFAEYERDFRQFSYRLKWMSSWIMQASFSPVSYQPLHLSAFFPPTSSNTIIWDLFSKKFYSLVFLPLTLNVPLWLTGISFVNFIYLTLISRTKIAVGSLCRTCKESVP